MVTHSTLKDKSNVAALLKNNTVHDCSMHMYMYILTVSNYSYHNSLFNVKREGFKVFARSFSPEAHIKNVRQQTLGL